MYQNLVYQVHDSCTSWIEQDVLGIPPESTAFIEKYYEISIYLYGKLFNILCVLLEELVSLDAHHTRSISIIALRYRRTLQFRIIRVRHLYPCIQFHSGPSGSRELNHIIIAYKRCKRGSGAQPLACASVAWPGQLTSLSPNGHSSPVSHTQRGHPPEISQRWGLRPTVLLAMGLSLGYESNPYLAMSPASTLFAQSRGNGSHSKSGHSSQSTPMMGGE